MYKIGCLLVRGIFLPAAQLFVIAIENILRGGVGNLTSTTDALLAGNVPRLGHAVG